ncbi:hypothetical protein N431DRAFT_320867, partial [Stipitochalara longipes BDJ]
TAFHHDESISSQTTSNMVFNSFKASLSSRRRRRVSTTFSEVPFVRYEDLPQTMTPPLSMMPDRSLRSILLPGIPSHKPLTITNFLTIGKTSAASTTTMAEGATAGCSTDLFQPKKSDGNQPQRKMTIRRKPVGLPDDPRRASYTPSFDPQAPRKDESLHLLARKVLLKRYQSKFTLPIDFIPHGGATIKNYEFLWVKPGELEKKVLEDIIWVRERFAYARRDEPTDTDIIYWYDADLFDEGNEAVWQSSWEALEKQAVEKLVALKLKEEAKAAEEAMDRASVEVNIGLGDDEDTE